MYTESDEVNGNMLNYLDILIGDLGANNSFKRTN